MLLVVGLLIVVGVFWWTRHTLDRSQPRREERLDGAMQPSEPFVDDSELPHLRADDEASPEVTPAPARAASETGPDVDRQAPARAPGAPEPPAAGPGASRAPSPAPRRGPPEPEAAPAESPAAPEAGEPEEAAPAFSDEVSGRTMLMVLYVVSRQGRLKGSELRAAFAAAGLRFGHMNLFHRMEGDRSRFSVANVLEPGQFDRDNMDHLETPAIVLYLRLPHGDADPHADLDDMVACARDLAEQLNAEVRDERRSVLTRQTVEHMHDQIREFQRAQRIPSATERRR